MSNDLTKKERLFVEAHLAGKNATDAALAAGYSPPYLAGQFGYRTLRRPRVQAAIRAELRLRVDCDLAPLALGTLKEIMLDREQPGGARVRAAQLALQAGDFISERGRALDSADPSGKPMSEMTVDELARAAAEQEARLSDALQVVSDLRAEAAAQAGALVIDAQPVLGADEDDMGPDSSDHAAPWS